MARFAPGTVVVYEQGGASLPGQPPQRVIATVTGGPWQDGSYDLDSQRQVRPESLWRLSTGDYVEYLSSSLNQWIPGRVLRPGRVPGTLDLDVKEAAAVKRLRPGGAAAVVPMGPAPLATLVQPGEGPCNGAGLPSAVPQQQQSAPTGLLGAVSTGPTLAPPGAPPGAGPAQRRGPRAGGWGPLGLAAGEHCFYRSSSHGWIPARVLGWRAEEQTYDLDVKQLVHPDSIRTIREGDFVEYQSTSTNVWIPARVVRAGREQGNYDLDVKPGADIKRMRPLEAPPPPAGLAAAGPPLAGPSPACGSSALGPALGPCANPLDASVGRGGTVAWPEFVDRVPSGAASSAGPGLLPPGSQGLPPQGWGPLSPLPAVSPSGSPLSGPSPCGTPPLGSGGLPGAGPGETFPRPPPPLWSGAEPALGPGSSVSGSSQWDAGQAGDHQSFRIREGSPSMDMPSSGSAVVPAALKLEQLREAVQAQDQEALRKALESRSVVLLQGEELDRASHTLWALEARPAALEELKRAASGSNPLALEAAIEAAAAVGAARSDLEAGSLALKGMRSLAWVYVPEDGKHIDIRAEPCITGPRTKHALQPGEIFRTSVEARGKDGVLYLKLSDGRGWVFQRKPTIGILCYRHQEDCPGPYVVTHDGVAVTSTVALGRDEDVVDRIAFGEVVEVVETACSEERIRGRLLRPQGWISLMSMETGKRWAEKRVP